MKARTEHDGQFEIDVRPMLSILASIVLIMALIGTVMTMRISLSPARVKTTDLSSGFRIKPAVANDKKPAYLDCFPDKIVIHPGEAIVTWDGLQRESNAVLQLFDQIQTNASQECLIIWARPHSVKFFRAVSKMAGQRPIDVTADVIDAEQ